jgi:hypothetical protein
MSLSLVNDSFVLGANKRSIIVLTSDHNMNMRTNT